MTFAGRRGKIVYEMTDAGDGRAGDHGECAAIERAPHIVWRSDAALADDGQFQPLRQPFDQIERGNLRAAAFRRVAAQRRRHNIRAAVRRVQGSSNVAMSAITAIAGGRSSEWIRRIKPSTVSPPGLGRRVASIATIPAPLIATRSAEANVGVM